MNPASFKGNWFKRNPGHPVEKVSWDEAVEFCRRLSLLPEEKQAGRVYRLPTEAEWEYACRAGTTTPYHFGASISSAQVNFNYAKWTTKVGIDPPNAWGLYDMHGNVCVWCADWYARITTAEEIKTTPKDRKTATFACFAALPGITMRTLPLHLSAQRRAGHPRPRRGVAGLFPPGLNCTEARGVALHAQGFIG